MNKSPVAVILGVFAVLILGAAFLLVRNVYLFFNPAESVIAPPKQQILIHTLENVEGVTFDGILQIFRINVSQVALNNARIHAELETDSVARTQDMQLVDSMEAMKGLILVRFVYLDGSGKCNPEDCAFIAVSPSMAGNDDWGCGAPDSARINASIIQPTKYGMEGGAKTWVVYKNIRFVGKGGCETGPKYDFQENGVSIGNLMDYSLEYLSTTAGCTVTSYARGQLTPYPCAQLQYYTQKTLQGIGPMPGEGGSSTLFVARTNGALGLYNANDLAIMASDQDYAMAQLNNVMAILQDANKLTNEQTARISSILNALTNIVTFNLGQ